MLLAHPDVVSGSQIGAVIIATNEKILVIGPPKAATVMEAEFVPCQRLTFGEINAEIARGAPYEKKWRAIAARITRDAVLVAGYEFSQSRQVLFLDATKEM